jgi:hypothetical protein
MCVSVHNCKQPKCRDLVHDASGKIMLRATTEALNGPERGSWWHSGETADSGKEEVGEVKEPQHDVCDASKW